MEIQHHVQVQMYLMLGIQFIILLAGVSDGDFVPTSSLPSELHKGCSCDINGCREVKQQRKDAGMGAAARVGIGGAAVPLGQLGKAVRVWTVKGRGWACLRLQRKVFADAVVFGDTNLEVPSALSNRTVVEVHMDIGCNVLSRHEKGLEINIDLPLHSRYPPLEGNGYSRVEIGAADLFTCCRIEEKSPQRNCLWMSIDQGSESKIGAVVWMIPSGIKAHAGAVSAVTFISALLSTLLIVLSSIYSPNFNNFGNSKKS
ncbi:hypothetical protein HHK36_033119 [Tetracentron sinense]|uniref:Phosphatidylinositol-glycan biosynthesis class X protein n=1 Tax=Tetracentron sinense TaxID=13715 RepID=A0A834Y850_TETSI|nr:hypothetical protein HHK36_033119 [Tetracentron sinense]